MSKAGIELAKRARASWHQRRSEPAGEIDMVALAREVAAQRAEAVALGLIDPDMIDAVQGVITKRLCQVVDERLSRNRDVVGVGVAEAVFGQTEYTNRLDRQLATASGAVADVVVELMAQETVSHGVGRFLDSHRTLRAATPRFASAGGKAPSGGAAS